MNQDVDGGRTCCDRRLVMEADTGEVRSGFSWTKGREDEVLMEIMRTKRKKTERTWGVEREGGVNRWMVTETVRADTAKKSTGHLMLDGKTRAGCWFQQMKKNEACMGKQR